MSFNSLSGTNVDVLRPEVWASQQTEAFRAKLVAAPFFADFSEDVIEGADTLNLPNASGLTANDKTNGSEVTLNQFTETSTVLSINSWKECSIEIEKRELAQIKKSYNILSRYMNDTAYAVAKAYDAAIIGQFTSFTNTTGASNAVIADSNILAAMAALENKDVDLSDCAFFFNPGVFDTQILALDKFTSDLFVEGKPVETGRVGRLYGIPVYKTTQIAHVSGTTGYVNALAHKDAIAHATIKVSRQQETINGEMVTISTPIDTEMEYIGKDKGFLISSDVIFGVAAWRKDAGCMILSK